MRSRPGGVVGGVGVVGVVGVVVRVLSAIVVPSILGDVAAVSAQSPSDTLSASAVAIACAPSLTVMPERAPVHSLRVVGSQDTVSRALFGIRELVVIYNMCVGADGNASGSASAGSSADFTERYHRIRNR